MSQLLVRLEGGAVKIMLTQKKMYSPPPPHTSDENWSLMNVVYIAAHEDSLRADIEDAKAHQLKYNELQRTGMDTLEKAAEVESVSSNIFIAEQINYTCTERSYLLPSKGQFTARRYFVTPSHT